MAQAETQGAWADPKELAQQAGCAEVTVRKIETGDLRRAPLAAALAKAVGASEADLPGLIALVRGASDDFTAKARLLRPQRPNNLAPSSPRSSAVNATSAAVRNDCSPTGHGSITLLGHPALARRGCPSRSPRTCWSSSDDGVFFVRLGQSATRPSSPRPSPKPGDLELTGPTRRTYDCAPIWRRSTCCSVLDNFEQSGRGSAARLMICCAAARGCTFWSPAASRCGSAGERQVMVRPLALASQVPTRTARRPRTYALISAVALFADAPRPPARLCRHRWQRLRCGRAVPPAGRACRWRSSWSPPRQAASAGRAGDTPARAIWLLSVDGLRDVVRPPEDAARRDQLELRFA